MKWLMVLNDLGAERFLGYGDLQGEILGDLAARKPSHQVSEVPMLMSKMPLTAFLLARTLNFSTECTTFLLRASRQLLSKLL